MTRTDTIALWLLRVAWWSLPLTAGGALATATRDWDAAIRVVAEVGLWAVWGAAIVALLAPRPQGLTYLRLAAPLGMVAAVAAGVRAGGASGWIAVVAAVLTLALSLAPSFTTAAVNGVAYGEERRYALRVPPALFLGPLPLAVAAVGGGAAAGPLLLAGGHWIVGAAALTVGVPAAVVAARAVHGLSRRWAVLVPAGLVLADPAAMDDPVLFRRERVRELRALPSGMRPGPGQVDLRLGAQRGSVAIVLDEDTDMVHVRRGRGRSEQVPTHVVWFALVGRGDFLAHAGDRKLPIART